tara:strand:+ start:7770 stop:8234 length:465 start_codon:yes stop_codon:yes gene_type:complete
MKGISLVEHAKGAPGLRFFGFGPGFKPLEGLRKLKKLFNKEAFWAINRTEKDLQIMLANSDVIISCWAKDKLIGFGRANSDKVFRATLWDVIIANEYQGKGIGKALVMKILSSKRMKKVEHIYLFTTNCSDFYQSMGFKLCENKSTLIKDNKTK